jgi:hypothetical protein
MSRKYFMAMLIIIALVLTISCSNSSNPKHRSPVFAIYLVKDMKTSVAAQISIDDLTLEDEPILTENDLVSYSWKDHKLKLCKSAIKRVPKGIPLDGKPFVVVVNGDRAYLGALWARASSLIADIPVMFFEGDYLTIEPNYPSGQINAKDDPRNNKQVYNALRGTGKLIE